MSVTEPLARYIAGALEAGIPDEVAEKTSHHLLDTLAAIISGARMEPGIAGAKVTAAAPGGDECTVVAAGARADAMRAAFANGMSAHADETDDSHELSLTHPGCAVIPAALAVAEARGASGAELLSAIALGYDVSSRWTRAMWSDNETLRTQGHSTHAIGGLFGATAATAALRGLNPEQVAFALSYTGQEASGMRTWTRDVEHIEKAYVFAGMPATTGTWTTFMVEHGMPGVRDVFAGAPNMFEIFGIDPEPEVLIEDLGDTFSIIATNIKRYSVGSPIQAPLDALLGIIQEQDISLEQVAAASVRLPKSLARVVDDREMPNINLQYLATVALEDRDVGFHAAHDEERFHAWRAREDKPPLEVIRDEVMAPVRQAIATVTLTDGRSFDKHVTAVRGTGDNPMTREEVEHKAADLVAPVLGDEVSQQLLEHSRAFAAIEDVRELTALIAG